MFYVTCDLDLIFKSLIWPLFCFFTFSCFPVFSVFRFLLSLYNWVSSIYLCAFIVLSLFSLLVIFVFWFTLSIHLITSEKVFLLNSGSVRALDLEMEPHTIFFSFFSLFLSIPRARVTGQRTGPDLYLPSPSPSPLPCKIPPLPSLSPTFQHIAPTVLLIFLWDTFLTLPSTRSSFSSSFPPLPPSFLVPYSLPFQHRPPSNISLLSLSSTFPTSLPNVPFLP